MIAFDRILKKRIRYQLVFLGALFLLTNYAYSQIDKKITDCTFYYDSIVHRKVYTFVDKMPVYDSKNGFIVNLVSNMHIDSISDNMDTKGAVSFIVETDGTITNIKIIDAINDKIDKQIIGFLKKSNKWKAGYCNGIAVPVEVEIPYLFEFQ